MTINEYLKAFATGRMIYLTASSELPYLCQDLRPYVVCTDGFSASIQASYNHYCERRISQFYIYGKLYKRYWFDDKDSKKDEWEDYTHVEIGYPTNEVKEWLEYAEDPQEPTKTVYGCVPVEAVDKALEEHGGIDIQKTYDLWMDASKKYPDKSDKLWMDKIIRIDAVFKTLLSKS